MVKGVILEIWLNMSLLVSSTNNNLTSIHGQKCLCGAVDSSISQQGISLNQVIGVKTLAVDPEVAHELTPAPLNHGPETPREY